MTSLTENTDDYRAMVAGLILLERDATAAYVRILHRMGDDSLRETIGKALTERQSRLAELTRMSFALRAGAPDEADASHYLPTGRVALGSLSSDGAMLNAMRVGEDETVAAYERASAHLQASGKSRAMFERALAEAIRHRAWTQSAAEAHKVS